MAFKEVKPLKIYMWKNQIRPNKSNSSNEEMNYTQKRSNKTDRKQLNDKIKTHVMEMREFTMLKSKDTKESHKK